MHTVKHPEAGRPLRYVSATLQSQLRGARKAHALAEERSAALEASLQAIHDDAAGQVSIA